MKTNINYKIYVVALFSMMIAINVFGQRVTRSNQQKPLPEKSQTERSSNKKDYTNNYSKGDKDVSNRQGDVAKHSKQSNNKYNQYNSREKEHHGRYPQYDYAHAKNHKKVNNTSYYKGLPQGKVYQFSHGENHYYNCNNKFYRYHPKYGYYMVSSPFTMVTYLPRNCYIKVINNQRYIYSRGFYYIPFQGGFMQIPEFEHNTANINFSFSW